MVLTTSSRGRSDHEMRKSNTRRDGGLDALRASLTLLVLFHHAAITYGASGDWYYKEVRTGPDLSSQLLSLFSGFNQAFFMGLFFLLAGYFTLGAVERHGAAVYIRERAVRLGLPLIIYFLLLSPATMALAATARGRNFFAALVGNWTQGRMEPGPLWFCEALLIFAGLYLAIRRLRAGPRAPGLAVFPLRRDARAGCARHGRRRFPAASRLAYGRDAALSATRLFRQLCRSVRGRMPRRALGVPR